MADLGAMFDEHVASEFVAKDVAPDRQGGPSSPGAARRLGAGPAAAG